MSLLFASSDGGSSILNKDVGLKFSNDSIVELLSCYVYVKNFSSHFTVLELWNTCDCFGRILDVYIPKNISKLRKPFAFVRFNMVDNMK